MNLNDILDSLGEVMGLLETAAQHLDQDDFTTAMQRETASIHSTVMDRLVEITAHLNVTKNTRRQPYE